jgi:phosphoglycolate phosphatase
MKEPDISVVLFDLDGTVVDSAGEIADATNTAIAPLTGGKALDYELVRSWVGNGAGVLLRTALRHCGIDEADLETEFHARWGDFRTAYSDCCGTNSSLYPGALECLEALRQAGCRLAIVTNKEGEFTEKLLAAHNIRHYFEVVVSGDTLPVKKPDPEVFWSTLNRLDVDRRKVLFVGDSMVDLRTGAAAGVRTWAVTHGYHHGEFDTALPESLQPERFVSGFQQLQELLTAPGPATGLAGLG